MLHDVAGEVLCDRRIRVTRTPYLPHAHAVIFLVDPLEIEAIRERLQQKAPHLVEDYKEWNQANLLNECINEIRRHSNLKTVPFAIVLLPWRWTTSSGSQRIRHRVAATGPRTSTLLTARSGTSC